MFASQRGAVPDLETPNWIAHAPGESFRDYAARFARTLNVESPVVLAGVSMGGMVALEMARVVPARCVVLIGSCRGPAAASRLLRTAERLSRLTPSILLDKGRIVAPLFLGRGGSLNMEHRRLLADMVRGHAVSFLRWAARAIIEWEGCEDPGVPVYHIHGDRDWVIPLSRVRPTRIVARGIHVLNFSHPAEVNAFLAECRSKAENHE